MIARQQARHHAWANPVTAWVAQLLIKFKMSLHMLMITVFHRRISMKIKVSSLSSQIGE